MNWVVMTNEGEPTLEVLTKQIYIQCSLDIFSGT